MESESYSFKAETRQLLDILIHSLYKEREVFLRELLSNASDALNRLHYEMLTDHQVSIPAAELCVRITVDKEKRLLTLQDTGIGMTRMRSSRTSAPSPNRAWKFLEATKRKKPILPSSRRNITSGYDP